MADVLYSFDREERYLIVRGVDNTLTATWSVDGDTVTPTPGTFRLRRPGGDNVVPAAAFTVSGNEAQYTIPAATTADELLSEGWVVEWGSVGFPDGSTRSFIAEAALVLYTMSPPARVQDLYKRFARLDPTHPSPLVLRMDLQDKIHEAWREIEFRLQRSGRRPELVMSPTQFRIPCRELALTLTFEDLAVDSGGDAYLAMAEQLREGFENHWRGLEFTYDADEDGLPDGGADPIRQGVQPTTWLTSRGLEHLPSKVNR